ncbi:MAG: HEXXH motif-containing putative peptide modification protein [Nitrospirota bacterium]|nr:HEXXH motif-containing putative peptide modification protein [Nitrospirota bacterium]
MPTRFPLFHAPFLLSLLEEFRTAMRRLLTDLCDELDGPYRQSSQSLQVPTPFVRAVGASLAREEFSNWKVIGWIEELNDLVYLLDVREQLRRESDTRGFVEAFYVACEDQFYEHGYLEDLFPEGRPTSAALTRRLNGLCSKLAQQVTRESIFLVPGLPCRWVAETTQRPWSVPFEFGPHFERAELPGIPYGLEGGVLVPPAAVQRRIRNAGRRAGVLIRPDGIDMCIRMQRIPLMAFDASPQWQWRVVPPCHIGSPLQGNGGLTLGPTLVYGADRTPVRVVESNSDLASRFERAVDVIRSAWPEGAHNLAMLTTRVVPLKARGVVSFSYRHRPGLSFINCFDRGQFDLIDDLIHENSHHQLNLFLRKATLIQGDRNEEIFYSPWRRSLRPLRGILHATFTFTMGAILFERLSSNAARLAQRLSKEELLRARARCLEEIASVQYSFKDLDWAAKQRWLTAAGVSVVDELKREIKQVAKRIARYEPGVKYSRYGSELQRRRNELACAANLYRSGRKIGD